MAVEKMHLVNIMAKLEHLDSFLENLIEIDEFDQVDALRQIQNREFSITANEANIDKTEDFNNIESFEKLNPLVLKKLEDMKEFLDLEDNKDTKRIDKEKLEYLYNILDEKILEKKKLEERNNKLEEYIKNLTALENEDIDINRVSNLNYFNYRLGEVSKDGRFILKNNYESIPSLIIHLKENDPDIEINRQALGDIYNIDKDTKKLRDDTDEVLKNEKDNVNKVSLELNENYDKKTKENSSKLYDDILSKADNESKEIEEFYSRQKSETEKTYKNKKNSIIEDFFKKIVK